MRSWVMDMPTSWPEGDGEMAGRIRSFAWGTTPLGPIGAWPRGLTSMVDLVLSHPFPMAVLWGPDAILIYNDAYRAILDGGNPAGLGHALAVTWPEFHALAAPLLDRVWAGETKSIEDAKLASVQDCGRVDGWYSIALSPLRDDGGAVSGALATVFDTTRRMRAERALREKEAHQSLLLAELQHRVRNVLGVVRSLVGRTLENAQSLEDAADHLEGRLSALARTQATLTRTIGIGVDLEMLVRDELMAQAADDGRVTLSGSPVALPPRAAEVLTLVIHELATNALKYGAFAASTGRLAIRWRVQGPPGSEQQLELVWEERGARVLAAVPRREGFGQELLTRRVPYDLDGECQYELRLGGAFCRIRFPLREQTSVLQTRAPETP